MEVAGLVISGVGVVALASTVSDCFRQVDAARNLGKDYQDMVLQLQLADLCYNRWRKNVKFIDDMDADFERRLPVASANEVETVKKLLGSIKVAFDAAHEKSKRLEAQAGGASSGSIQNGSNSTLQPAANTATSTATVQLAERVSAVSKQHQKAASVLDKIKWTLYDAKVLEKLVTNVERNVKSLVNLFPAIKDAQIQQAVKDMAVIVPVDAHSAESQEELATLQRQGASADPALSRVALTIRSQYSDIDLEDTNDVLFGDEISAADRSPQYGSPYRGIKVKRGKQLVFGNRHVGKEVDVDGA